MENAIYELYHKFVEFEPSTPEYDRALEEWSLALSTRDDRNLEDAAHFLRNEWGIHAFRMGLDLGLSLGLQLNPQESQ
ncbi:MAG: hypothetical protein EOM52_13030 [Clostridia bacterium]|nr:hypothetical protein [Clostridia bacterium]